MKWCWLLVAGALLWALPGDATTIKRGPGSGGAGDIESVGSCTTGACTLIGGTAAQGFEAGETGILGNVFYNTTQNVWCQDNGVAYAGDSPQQCQVGDGVSAGDGTQIHDGFIGPHPEIYVIDFDDDTPNVASPAPDGDIDSYDLQAAINSCGKGYLDLDLNGGCKIILPPGRINMWAKLNVGSAAANGQASGIIIEGQGQGAANSTSDVIHGGTKLVWKGPSGLSQNITSGFTVTLSKTANPDTITASGGTPFAGIVAGDVVIVSGTVNDDQAYEVASVDGTSRILTLNVAGGDVDGTGPDTDVIPLDEAGVSATIILQRNAGTMIDFGGCHNCRLADVSVEMDDGGYASPVAGQAAVGVRLQPLLSLTNNQFVTLDNVSIYGSLIGNPPFGSTGILISDAADYPQVQTDKTIINRVSITAVDIAIENRSVQAVQNMVTNSNIFGYSRMLRDYRGNIDFTNTTIGCYTSGCVVVDFPFIVNSGPFKTVFDNVYLETGVVAAMTVFKCGAGYSAGATVYGHGSHILIVQNSYFNNQLSASGTLKVFDCAKSGGDIVVTHNEFPGSQTYSVQVSGTTGQPESSFNWIDNFSSEFYRKVVFTPVNFAGPLHVFAPKYWSENAADYSGVYAYYNDKNLDNNWDSGEDIAPTALDAVGANPITIGSADVTAVTVTTDGTGNTEVVLPNASIGPAELSAADTLAGNPTNGASSVAFATTGLIFEGATSDTNEGLLIASDIAADRTWTLPLLGGTLVSSADTGTVTSAMIADSTITGADLGFAADTRFASGTSVLGTGAIASTACASVVQETTGSGTGLATTDVITWTPTADLSAVTGYTPATTGALIIYAYPTTNHVNFKVCNPTSGSITPGGVTLNWKVDR